MLFEVEVVAGENSPMDLNRVFDLLSEPRPIRRVFTADRMDVDMWCEVTGWSEAGPCPGLRSAVGRLRRWHGSSHLRR